MRVLFVVPTAAKRWVVRTLTWILLLCCRCFDLSSSEASEMVLANLILLDKSVTCFRLFIAAYRQVHAQGADTFAVSCLIGLSIYLCCILICLYTNHRSQATAWV